MGMTTSRMEKAQLKYSIPFSQTALRNFIGMKLSTQLNTNKEISGFMVEVRGIFVHNS